MCILLYYIHGIIDWKSLRIKEEGEREIKMILNMYLCCIYNPLSFLIRCPSFLEHFVAHLQINLTTFLFEAIC